MAHGDEPEEGEAYGEGYMAPPAHRLRAGTLLIANTNLFEPTFRRSVIFIVEHNDGGTLGVVLNRPSETAVYNVLPQWAKLAGKPKTMFIGGPVKRDAALCLATLRAGVSIDGVKGLRHVAGRMAMVDLDAEPEDIAPLVEGIRVFAGYSGWTIGQLEGEVERDDWIVLSALPSDVLTDASEDLWAKVLRRQPERSATIDRPSAIISEPTSKGRLVRTSTTGCAPCAARKRRIRASSGASWLMIRA